MDEIEQGLIQMQRQTLREELLDRFLDLYADWRRSGSIWIGKQVVRLAKELELIDPDFHFRMAA